MEENILKNKSYKTVNLSPYINKSSTFMTYLAIFIAVVPQIIMLFVTKSYSNLIIIATCIFACLCSEIINYINKKHIKLSILMSFLKGTLIGFFLPSGYPLLSVFFITLFVMLFVKYSFGDLIVSWINPVVITVAICWFVGQINFPSFLVTKYFLSTKNPSLSLIQEGIFPIFAFDDMVTSFMNDSAFSLFGVSVPSGYASLFWDSGSVIPAFRFNFLTLLSSIVLISIDVITFDIPFCFLTVYALLVKFLSPVFSGGFPMQGDIILALLSSGILFTAFFLLQWFGTTPMTKAGKLIFGIAGGIIAFIFCGCGTSPVGAVISVLFLNIISPVIQYFENRIKRNKLNIILRKENA
ncbi:MAG: RnfABCDGE type electron transport complex subunit D [Treponema sp.]|nr:RnfABCDGE type electron transport complex subunit D [Candidatus Treponema merdequi]